MDTYTHEYDTVLITSPVPWEELAQEAQYLAEKVVDVYRMQASVKVDAEMKIHSLNIEYFTPEEGMVYSMVVTVEALPGQQIPIEDYLPSLLDDDVDGISEIQDTNEDE